MNEKIEKHLERIEKTRRRSGPLRETVALGLRGIPHIRRIIEFFVEGLKREAPPPDPRQLGESTYRAEVRAAAADLRYLPDFLAESTRRLVAREEVEGATIDPADRRLSRWVEEQRREVMRLAVRFERRVGPAPEGGEP